MKSLKRILVLAVVAVFAVTSANAQFRWGIKAGMVVNKLDFSSNATTGVLSKDNSYGWTAGVMAEVGLPFGLAVDGSLMYARMNNNTNDVTTGATLTENGLETSSTNVYGKNFLEIPINLKWKVPVPVVGHIIRPYVFTGPNFAFKLDKNVGKNLKSHTCQVAWDLGIGLELVQKLQIGAGYSWGLNDVAKWTGINSVDIKAKNNYWTVTAAYLF